MVTAASVLGQEFSVGALANVTDVGGGLDGAVSTLSASALLVELDGHEPAYRFRHSLIQEAIYKGLLRHQRRRLHARAAWGLEASSAGRLEEAAALLGHHFAMAGEVERACHYLDIAGDHAASVFANDEAVVSYRRALEVVGAVPGGMTTEAVQLWLKLGTLFWRLGRYAEGRAALQGAAGLAASWERVTASKMPPLARAARDRGLPGRRSCGRAGHRRCPAGRVHGQKLGRLGRDLAGRAVEPQQPPLLAQREPVADLSAGPDAAGGRGSCRSTPEG